MCGEEETCGRRAARSGDRRRTEAGTQNRRKLPGKRPDGWVCPGWFRTLPFRDSPLAAKDEVSAAGRGQAAAVGRKPRCGKPTDTDLH